MHVAQRVRLLVVSALFAGTLAVPAARADDPTLYVQYAMDCTFTIVGDNGRTIATIPPGRYQILVTSPIPFMQPDLTGQDPNFACGGELSFRLTGPGVDLHTSLYGGGSSSDELVATFQVGSYVAVEDRRPAATRLVIAIAAGAASTGGGSTSSPASSSSGSSATTTAPKPKVKEPAVSTAFRGTLAADVSPAGKATLQLKGKAVAFVKGGRYKLTVLDETPSGSFTIQKLGTKPVTVTAPSFIGRRSTTLTLKAGQWVFYSTSGRKSYFVVTA